MTRLLLRIAVAVSAVVAGFCVTLVLFQDRLIHPAILSPGPTGKARIAGELPAGVASYFFRSGDELLEAWFHLALTPHPAAPRVALIFHGNGESVENNLYLLQLLSQQGFDAYVFDYRGYGRSSGVPEEGALYQDVDSFLQFVGARYPVEPQYLYWGGSLGTGFASYAATRQEPAALVLLAPYSSLPEVVQAHPWYGLLYRFLWWNIPTAHYVRALSSSCLMVVHGDRDTVIPHDNSARIVAAYQGRGEVTYLRFPEGDHFNILELAERQLLESIQRCISDAGTAGEKGLVSNSNAPTLGAE